MARKKTKDKRLRKAIKQSGVSGDPKYLRKAKRAAKKK